MNSFHFWEILNLKLSWHFKVELCSEKVFFQFYLLSIFIGARNIIKNWKDKKFFIAALALLMPLPWYPIDGYIYFVCVCVCVCVSDPAVRERGWKSNCGKERMWMYTLHISFCLSLCVCVLPFTRIRGEALNQSYFCCCFTLCLSITHTLYPPHITRTRTHWWLFVWRHGRTKKQNLGFPSLPFYPTCRISSIS